MKGYAPCSVSMMVICLFCHTLQLSILTSRSNSFLYFTDLYKIKHVSAAILKDVQMIQQAMNRLSKTSKYEHAEQERTSTSFNITNKSQSKTFNPTVLWFLFYIYIHNCGQYSFPVFKCTFQTVAE